MCDWWTDFLDDQAPILTGKIIPHQGVPEINDLIVGMIYGLIPSMIELHSDQEKCAFVYVISFSLHCMACFLLF